MLSLLRSYGQQEQSLRVVTVNWGLLPQTDSDFDIFLLNVLCLIPSGCHCAIDAVLSAVLTVKIVQHYQMKVRFMWF